MDASIDGILDTLRLEQQGLDQKIEHLAAQAMERRTTQKTQQASFSEQILQANYEEDAAQFARFFQRVLLRNRALLPEGWEAADLLSGLKTFISMKDDLERDKARLQRQLDQETHALIMEQMKGVGGLQKDCADVALAESEFREVYERYKRTAETYVRALDEFVGLKAALKELTPESVEALRRMQRELRQ